MDTEQATTPTPRSTSYLWLYPVVMVFAAGLLAWGIALFANDRSEKVILAAGALAVIGVFTAWARDINARAMFRENRVCEEATFGPVNERLQHISVLLNEVSEQQLLSERAKAVAFREKDRDALRRAIREEMARRDFDAALMLVNDIETSFGYKQEADQFREEINKQRSAEIRKKVNESASAIDRFIREEKWTQAVREAERINQFFPDDPQAQNLPQEIEARRLAFKRQLRDAFDDALRRHDVDAGVALVKKLDFYLTPEEAQTMQEQARALFRDKLQQLGQQFTLAVKEHKWHDAIRLGEHIATDFPNTRMAQEVRERMDLLKQRAAEPEPEPARV